MSTKSKTQQFFDSPVQAGFPNFINDPGDITLNLHELMVENPDSTFFVRVKGDSMELKGIYEGDLLVVDKSLEAQSGDTVVAFINNEFTVKELVKSNGLYVLRPWNKKYKDIVISDIDEFRVWGVVTYTVHKSR